MKAEKALKKLKDWLSGHSTKELRGLKAPFFPFYDNYSPERFHYLIIESNDNKGKFFAVPGQDWYGYVSNNIEDSFYILRGSEKIHSWNEGDNTGLIVPSNIDNAPFGNRSYIRYTWTVNSDVYDITNLVMKSDFSFLNWSDDNPWEVKQ